MAYVRKNWLNKNSDGTIPNGAIPVSADNLNRIEDGIEEALNRVKIGNFTISDGRCEVKLGFKPRYLTVVSDSGMSSFSLFQNTACDFCQLTYDGFDVDGTRYMTNEELSEYFDIYNNSYYFVYDSGTNKYASNNNNQNLHNTEAKTTLSAKDDINIEFTYGYSSESSDRFYITIQENGKTIQTIEDGASGTTTEKTYKGTIKAGQSIIFKYKKDQSVDKNSDQCYFKDIKKIGVENGLWSYMAIK